MSNTLSADYRKFSQVSGYCTPPGKAVCAIRSARTLAKWREAEQAGLVRIRAEEEQENYFDVYGKPDDEKEFKAICRELERNGCWCVISEYWNGAKWRIADSVGMCTGYDDPTDPFQNDYVIDLMASALEKIPQQGEH